MKRLCLFLLVGLFASPNLLLAVDPKPLDRVPKDAAVFAHVRIGNAFENALVAEFLKQLDPTILNEVFGADALKSYFGLTLQDAETLTFVCPQMTAEADLNQLVCVEVVTKKPYDKKSLTEKLKRRIIENAPKGKLVPKERMPRKLPDNVLQLESVPANLVFHGERELTIVPDRMLDNYLSAKLKATGPHDEMLKKAASGDYHIVVGYNPAAGIEQTMEAEGMKKGNRFIGAILPEYAHATLAIKKGIELEAVWKYANKDKTKEGLESVQTALKGLTDWMFPKIFKDAQKSDLLPFWKLLDAQVSKIEPKIEGNTVRAQFSLVIDDLAKLGKLVSKEGLVILNEKQRANNLRQLGLSFHNHESAFDKLPGAAICDKDDKPLLSWRVAILPYIEEEALYKQFKLDEPWDSKNNKPLIEKMPKIFTIPNTKDKEGTTRYRVFVGDNAMFTYKKALFKFANIPDGTSNTGLIFESANAVIWTKPDEMDFNPKQVTTDVLYFDKNDRTFMVMCDGWIISAAKKKLGPALRIIIGPNDGEVNPGLSDDE